MKVSCEHTPVLTIGLAAVPVQPRIPHLAYLFPRLIPFHTSLPNFPFQCSFPAPHLPSKFLFSSFTVFPLTNTQVPFNLCPVPNFFSAPCLALLFNIPASHAVHGTLGAAIPTGLSPLGLLGLSLCFPLCFPTQKLQVGLVPCQSSW